MYTFLKALDEKRSNPWCSRCQSFTEKKFGLKGTSPLINPNTFTFSMSEIVDFGVHFFYCIFDPDHGIGNTMQKV